MSKIYFTSDWDKLFVYIFGNYTPEPWPGKLLVKNSDSGMYEIDVTGYENENLVIHDNGSNQLSDKTVSSLVNKILDTTSGSIVDYNEDQDTQESKKIVTVKNLKKFLEKTDIRHASKAEVSEIASSVSKKANDSDVVHTSGNESITGSKTFTGSVSLPKDTEFNITESEVNEILGIS